jgi:hypothetical protein
MALEPVESSPDTAGHAVRKSILAGLGGATGLFSFYFILLALLAGSWQHPLDELLALKYWIGALILGFGIQIGMFYHIRNVTFKGHGGKAAAAGTGTTSGHGRMPATITDVLPSWGLAGVPLPFEYKIAFIAFGIIK